MRRWIARYGWRWGLCAATVGAGAALLARWSGLQQTLWWYPESDAYQLWVALLVVAASGSFLLGPRLAAARPPTWTRRLSWLLELLWLAMSALALSGLWQLANHIRSGRTTGDLLQGYLAGARRRSGGQPVYDQRGLDQSVNASPLLITLALPLAGLSDDGAIGVYLACQGALLLLYLLLAGSWVQRLKGRVRPSDLGLALCGLTTFFSFQRSLRLGQIDLLLLTLLLAAVVWGAGQGRLQRAGSALAAALAAAIKLAPAVLVLGRLWPRRGPSERRWLLTFGLALGLLAAAAALALGPRQAADFARNLPAISAGTTSGNNYSLAPRISSWGDRERRAAHHPLSASERLFQRALAGLALLVLLALSWRWPGGPTELRDSIWLAALPLLSPLTWDIYLVWCGFLPWWFLWSRLEASYRRRPHRRLQLLAVLALGGYLLGGTAGNTMFRDLHTGLRIQLELPVWLDGMPLWGQLVTLVTLLATSFQEQRWGDHPTVQNGGVSQREEET